MFRRLEAGHMFGDLFEHGIEHGLVVRIDAGGVAQVEPEAGLDLSAALANELRLGREVLASGESQEGAARFARGAGRHGRFDEGS